MRYIHPSECSENPIDAIGIDSAINANHIDMIFRSSRCMKTPEEVQKHYQDVDFWNMRKSNQNFEFQRISVKDYKLYVFWEWTKKLQHF